MDTIGEATETGAQILTWFTDYGALQVLAMLCIVQFLAWPILFVYCVRKIGQPLATIADWLEENSAEEQKKE